MTCRVLFQAGKPDAFIRKGLSDTPKFEILICTSAGAPMTACRTFGDTYMENTSGVTFTKAMKVTLPSPE